MDVKYPKVYKVLICGDRQWSDRKVIERELLKLIEKYGESMIVITGGATGADSLGASVARQLNLHVAEVMALWNTRFRSAGPQRNRAMLSLMPNEVIAFHTHLAASRGTKDMLKQAETAGVPNRLVSS